MTINQTEAIQVLREACSAALHSHGMSLTSMPPQDAWTFNRVDEKLRAALAATSHIAPDAAPAGKRDILAICDAYESGMGHGLERDGHKSGAIFGNPECGEAYELGYEEGFERSGEASPAIAPEPHVTPEMWGRLTAAHTQYQETAQCTAEIRKQLGLGVDPAIAPEASDGQIYAAVSERHASPELRAAADEVLLAIAPEVSELPPLDTDLARMIVQDTNDTLREQAETMLALKVENDDLRAAIAIPVAAAAEPVPTDLSKELREYAKGYAFRSAEVLAVEAADELDRLAATKPAASEAVGVSDSGIIGIAAKSGVFATIPQVLQFGRDMLSLAAPAAPNDAKPLPDAVQFMVNLAPDVILALRNADRTKLADLMEVGVRELQAAEPTDAGVRDKLRDAVLSAWANYERMGEVCSFEGQSMIYASTLEELAEIAKSSPQALKTEGSVNENS